MTPITLGTQPLQRATRPSCKRYSADRLLICSDGDGNYNDALLDHFALSHLMCSTSSTRPHVLYSTFNNILDFAQLTAIRRLREPIFQIVLKLWLPECWGTSATFVSTARRFSCCCNIQTALIMQPLLTLHQGKNLEKSGSYLHMPTGEL